MAAEGAVMRTKRRQGTVMFATEESSPSTGLVQYFGSKLRLGALVPQQAGLRPGAAPRRLRPFPADG